MIAWVRRRWDIWSVRLVALLAGVMGAVNVLSAVRPSFADRLRLLRQVSPLSVRQGGHLTAALAGFALLMLASSLWRRKRVAWLLTWIVLIVSAISHLVKGLDHEEAGLAAALALGIWLLRSRFHARSDPPSIWQGLRALIAALIFTLAYGAIGFYVMDRHLSATFRLQAALEQTVIMFTQFYDPGLMPIPHVGRYFASSIYVVGAATLSYASFMLLRPVLVRHPATSDEHARAEAIVRAHGRTALARFALFDDKSYYFSPGGSVLAYVVKGRVALVLGDPIGPVEDANSAITGFRQYALSNDWLPAFYQALPANLEYYKMAGFEAACIGHEAIASLKEFSLEGKANKNLRSSVTKLARLGYRTEHYEPPLSSNALHELREVSDEWLVKTGGAEMRYSLGAFEDDYVRSTPVSAVRAPDGRVTAFANLVVQEPSSEIAVDLMRHRREVENGTMDFLFVKIIEWAKARGYATFDLGLSALAGVGEDSDDPAVERALHYIYEHIYHFYNFKGLHAFKDKFHPQWAPRYIIYPGAASLPSVALALIEADSGLDVTWDSIKGWLARRWRRDTQRQDKEGIQAWQPSEQEKVKG
jgi:phosphatidylglycerol lysyltransferase